MFEASIQQSVLSEVLAISRTLDEEAVFQFNEDGLTVHIMDRANVGMVHVTISSDEFESYKTDGVRLGMKLPELTELVKMGGSDALDFAYNEETHKLDIDAGSLSYSMSLIDSEKIAGANGEVPSLEFDAIIPVTTSEFTRAIKAMDMVSDFSEFIVQDGKFQFTAHGDTDSVELDVEADARPGDSGTVNNCTSKFSINYLKDLSKALSVTEFDINLANDMPVMFSFPLSSCDGDGVFLMAPRIDSS